MINLITGYAGEPHVTSDQARWSNLSIFGRDNIYVADVLNSFDYELDGLKIKIKSGILINRGAFICIDYEDEEEVQLAPCKADETRLDWICITYEKHLENGIETATINVKSADEIIRGDISQGDLIDDYPLYEVTVTGQEVSDIKKHLFDGGMLGGFSDSVYDKIVTNTLDINSNKSKISNINNSIEEFNTFKNKTIDDLESLNNKTQLATTGKAGLISASDFIKLGSIQKNANYVAIEDKLDSTDAYKALSANQGRILNEKIQGGDDTGWINCELKSPFEDYGDGSQPLQVRKVGKVVEIRGAVKTTKNLTSSASMGQVITVLDEQFRPDTRVVITAFASGVNIAMFNISSTGEVTLERYLSTKDGTYTTVTNTMWIQLQATYTVGDFLDLETKTFKCEDCGAESGNQLQLKNHSQTVHAKSTE